MSEVSLGVAASKLCVVNVLEQDYLATEHTYCVPMMALKWSMNSTA